MPRPRPMPAPRAASAPRGSACRAPSTCSSRPTASARCARWSWPRPSAPATRREFDILKEIVDRVAGQVMQQAGATISYLVGTMIELPRAALLAGDIARSAAFFSFGTNDLTQTTYGISRDDSTSFSAAYQKLGIFEHDPFVTLDRAGVGEMVKIAAERGRKTRPDIKLGICGEHGGDPASIQFCREIGLDYVSCSPYRVPIARLAAAQAELTGDAGGSTA